MVIKKRFIVLILISFFLFPLSVNANILCNDGTYSPSCQDCHRGCCSHHGGCATNSNNSYSNNYSNYDNNNNNETDSYNNNYNQNQYNLKETEETKVIENNIHNNNKATSADNNSDSTDTSSDMSLKVVFVVGVSYFIYVLTKSSKGGKK